MAKPPPLLTDPDQVADRGRELLTLQWEWYDAVFPRLQANDAQIAQSLEALTTEIMALIDCRTCGRCCRNMGPQVNAAEIATLAQVLALTPSSFRIHYLKPLWPDAPDDEQSWVLPAPCPLHDGLLCTVYEQRPQICRDFPANVGRDLAEKIAIFIESARTSPITFNVIERLRSQIPFSS